MNAACAAFPAFCFGIRVPGRRSACPGLLRRPPTGAENWDLFRLHGNPQPGHAGQGCLPKDFWWALQDSNLRLPPCEGGTLPLS